MGISKVSQTIGQKFGKLTVLSMSHVKRRVSFFKCVCECGNETVTSGTALRTGQTKSCGCLVRETASKNMTKHGCCGTPEYDAYMRILSRCHNTKNKRFTGYGGRGIYVCERWLGENGFTNFLADVGNRPEKNYSIGRINNDGPYSPENCRWENQYQQAGNKRTSARYTFNGETHCIAEWARRVGVNNSAMRARIHNWGIDKAVTTPLPSKAGSRGSKAHPENIRNQS